MCFRLYKKALQYCNLCIFIVRVYVLLLLSMYSYCSSMYSYCCLCILIVVYVFLDTATLTEVFPCFFLGCKVNVRVILAKTGHGPHSSKIVVLFYVLFVLYCSMNCLCVNVYCHRVTTQLQLTNISISISFGVPSKGALLSGSPHTAPPDRDAPFPEPSSIT